MNNPYIFLDEIELSNKIEALKQERKKMYELFNNINSNFRNMKSYWSGNTGIKVSEYLDDYIKDFPEIIKKLDKDINFLENVIDAHIKMNNAINKRIDENANITML